MTGQSPSSEGAQGGAAGPADLRAAIRAEVAGIAPGDAREARDRAAALDWIDSGAGLCRLVKPATPPMHLVSYVVVVDDRAVLLVDHRNAGLWLPPGGHVDPGEHPRATAAREAMEELGLAADFAAPGPAFLTITETVGATAGHRDVSLWYVLRGQRGAALTWDAREFLGIHWFDRTEVPRTRVEPELGRFLTKWFG